jgi:protein-L-isoaspartate(D-aspartate) O-methyltransferase
VLLVGADAIHGAALARCLVGATGQVQVAVAERETAAEVRRQLRRAAREVKVTLADPTRAARATRGGFHAILVERCAPRIPAALCDRLREGGRLVVAVGPMFRAQRLTLVVRTRSGLEACDLGPIHVPPLVGEQGWLRE